MDKFTNFVLPTTFTVLQMGHLILKFCWSNIYPRIRNHSNFTYQDLVIVFMIMSNRAFDVFDLIRKTIFNVLDKTKTSFSYGCLLTRIFRFYQVESDDYDKVEATQFLDEKSLNQSHLFVSKDGILYQISPGTLHDHLW